MRNYNWLRLIENYDPERDKSFVPFYFTRCLHITKGSNGKAKAFLFEISKEKLKGLPNTVWVPASVIRKKFTDGKPDTIMVWEKNKSTLKKSLDFLHNRVGQRPTNCQCVLF